MATGTYPLTKVNYISKDFLTLRDELLQRLPIITNGKWSNLNESDPGIAMLEVFMSMVDNLLFYQDMMAQEVYLPTARQRNNVIKLLRLIGYEFNSVTASVGTVTVGAEVGSTPIYPITILKGTQFSAQSSTTNQTLVFTTTQSSTLSSPSDTKTIPVIQGTNTTETFTSDGSPSQRFSMSNTSIDKSTVVVKVNNSLPWTMVASFFESTYTSTHFKVEIDEFSRVSVLFGDGQFGQIPNIDATIQVDYVITDAANGNVGKNAISRIISSSPFVSDNTGNNVRIAISSSEATAGGADIESIEHAKQTALGLLFGLRRALSRQDYMALATSIPGVEKAIAWGENEEINPDYRLFNKVRVSFLSKIFLDMYYNPVSRASYRSLRDNQVKNLLLSRMPVTTRLSFIDPLIIDCFATFTIGINTTSNDPNVVIDTVKSNILEFYDFDNIDFGKDIRISDLLGIVNKTEGVAWGILNRLGKTPPNNIPDDAPYPPVDMILNKWEIPSFNDINVTPSTTANTIKTVPYLQVVIPLSTTIGMNDISVINPDKQSNALSNAFIYYPSPNDKHITVNYTTTTDQPTPSGGYYGSPDPESDSPVYTSSI